jgi:hypothetical protein
MVGATYDLSRVKRTLYHCAPPNGDAGHGTPGIAMSRSALLVREPPAHDECEAADGPKQPDGNVETHACALAYRHDASLPYLGLVHPARRWVLCRWRVALWLSTAGLGKPPRGVLRA